MTLLPRTSSHISRLASGLMLLSVISACLDDTTAPIGNFAGQWGGGDMQLTALHYSAELDVPCTYLATPQGIVLDEDSTFTFRAPFVTTEMVVDPPLATVSGTVSGDSVVITLRVGTGAGIIRTLVRGTPPVRDSTSVCAV